MATRASPAASSWLAAALALLAPGAAHAADAPAANEQMQTCFACHGPEGNSIVPEIPSLAGQPPLFLSNELFQYREGDRTNEMMSPVAKPLTNADLNRLAAYFSAQKPAEPKRPADASIAPAAQDLIVRNRCNNCHGPQLAGLQQMPRLAGQQQEYLAAQLRAFRGGTRKDLDGQMAQAAQPLTDADIDLLANYLSALRAP
jgi:cytochrome c553